MWQRLRVSVLVLAGAALLVACGGGEPIPTSFPGLTVIGREGYLVSNLHVYKFDAREGREIWRFPSAKGNDQPRGPFAGQPVVIGDLVIVGGSITLNGAPDPHLYAISASDGSERWRFLPSPGAKEFADGVATDGKLIFAPNGDHTLYAIDPTAEDGQPRIIWTFTAQNKLWAKPVVADGRVYLPSLDHFLYALDAATGREVWRFNAGASIASTPTLADGVLYFGSFAQKLFAVRAEDGSAIWESPMDAWIWCQPLVRDEEVIVGDVKGKLYALDRRSGTRRWTAQVGGPIRAQPVAVADKLYVVSFDTYLYEIDLAVAANEGRKPVRRVLENGLNRRLLSDPMLVEDALLVPLFDGDVKLIAVDLRSGQKRFEFPPRTQP